MYIYMHVHMWIYICTYLYCNVKMRKWKYCYSLSLLQDNPWYNCNNIYLSPVSKLFDRLVLSWLILGTDGTTERTRKCGGERFRKSLISQLKVTEKRRSGAGKIRVQPPKYSSAESAPIAVGVPHPGDSDSVDQRLWFLNKHSSDLLCDPRFWEPL